MALQDPKEDGVMPQQPPKQTPSIVGGTDKQLRIAVNLNGVALVDRHFVRKRRKDIDLQLWVGILLIAT